MDFQARTELRRRVRDIVEPAVERCGCELVAVELASERGGAVLRLYIDRPKGVGLEDCARVTHVVSPELDVEDPIDGSYRLEVSSPGIDRPLERLDDFVRFCGYRAKIRLAPGPGRRRYSGRLAGVEDGQVLIDADGEQQRLPFDQIDRARLDLDLQEFEALGRAQPPHRS